MASTFFTSFDVPNSLDLKVKHHHPFNSRTRLKKFPFFYCNSSKSPPKSQVPDLSEEPKKQNPSLADQLQTLSTTILSDTPQKPTQLLTKPKSIWVNPTKPRPSVLNLQRQQRTSYSYNPQIRDLRLFAKKLNECENNKDAFLKILEDIPHPPTRENALLVLNNLKPWEKTLLFFDWLKTQESFPMETIFYNVTMKSLRFGRQFQLIENLAVEMIDNEIPLDNITYSTIITCAKRSNLFDKAVEWFERMYKTGLMPDEVTYSAVLDVYAKLGKVEEVMSLYERGRASGWTPDAIAFAVLAKMFGEAGDYDGIRYVLQEMKALGVKPNLVVFNTLLEAMGRAGKPGLARSLFEEMVAAGVSPDAKTLTSLVKIYGKARWARDALDLWQRMKSNGWPMDFILYNTLLSMCADLGLQEEAEKLFDDMKVSDNCKPDSWSYTAMLNIYGSGGNVEKAMTLFDQMSKENVAINVMGCTCLIQCLGRATRIDDLVMVFETSLKKGIRPDDRLCGCLLSVVSYCESGDDLDKVIGCLQEANPRLVSFVKLLEEKETVFEKVRDEFKEILNETEVEARRPFCNCLIDICRKRNLDERAHELLYLGTMYGLYPGLHTKTPEEWRLNVRSLSVGAAHTAFEEWVGTLSEMVNRQEPLPELLSASTGAGTHKYSQGLANAFESHVTNLSAPFRQSEEKPGVFVASREDIVSWVQSKV
ncbi:putative Smr domain, tetratricopeptide-like helical domain superfamily [Helianthus annuus]|uniref:Putative pentatricopeptide (PPR) repeat-containing protein n=1 Tax=Helianthus annuus TaxID=4232 RepID=A0A251S8J3_HELAN|nr:pentatricopeptide repeat-containing protein At5g46580, chloroplastic [Helianthus annuus]KAF5764629.1 putative Smr domain, tetratricopeptide-like helical domain superfamily [Helianthus annuus]KAJ0451283.1 putative Smr domain, tetratricopeptide-like helical domain superfamily [Helianthus annuus]KAJ0473152.1 putative Smr domain, tetratricopeptide-like helical domain superfamily [Helianthus annuus]KAJ0648754.1 putative Smr domain, tetratricopeptide-like helical domain superfamily [Helianthus ann